MRVLVLSTDKRLLEKESTVFKRHVAYAQAFKTLDVLVLGGKGEVVDGALSVHGVGASHVLLRGIAAFLAAFKISKPDVVTVQDPFETGLVGLLIAQWFRIPLHVQVHTDMSSPYFVKGYFFNRIRRIIARFVLTRAARIRVVSESIKESLQATSYKCPPISVLPIFVDREKYAHLSRTKHERFKVALLWIGRLEKEKDPLLAIQLLEIARKNGHDAGLILVGSGEQEEKLRDYVRHRGLERFVEFSGWRDDLAPHLSIADVTLVTSLYEGYGMVIIESLAAGVPVLSLDVGSARESGAMVFPRKEMGKALLDWISHGPRKGTLHNYPYQSFEEYVKAWGEDVRLAVRR